MTEPKSLVRRRRVASTDAVPPAVARWFAEHGAAPWEVLLDPERVPSWWRAWRATHPDAKPPTASWIKF